MSTAATTITTHLAPDRAETGVRPGLCLPALSLCKRELVRFLRQRHRIIGALATPIVFWLLIGAGMGRSFHFEGLPGGGNYLQYFFPGTVLMILLFTAIFSTISIIEDRREGFLQSVLVAPVPRMSIVLGKVLGGTVLAFGQGLIFLILAAHWNAADLPRISGGVRGHVYRLVRAHRPWLYHRVAHDLDAGVSCDHESVSDAALVFVRRSFSAAKRLGRIAMAHAAQSAQLRPGRLVAGDISARFQRDLGSAGMGNDSGGERCVRRCNVSDCQAASARVRTTADLV